MELNIVNLDIMSDVNSRFFELRADFLHVFDVLLFLDAQRWGICT